MSKMHRVVSSLHCFFCLLSTLADRVRRFHWTVRRGAETSQTSVDVLFQQLHPVSVSMGKVVTCLLLPSEEDQEIAVLSEMLVVVIPTPAQSSFVHDVL